MAFLEEDVHMIVWPRVLNTFISVISLRTRLLF